MVFLYPQNHLTIYSAQIQFCEIKFEDLKYNQFVAGEMEIIIACKNDKEKTGRLRLLKKISYYYELYDWKALLQFYAVWILFNLFCFGLTELANNGVSISTALPDHLFCPDSILRIHASYNCNNAFQSYSS
jgi:hypothetical protein